MENLKSLMEGEYSNNADLLGIDTEGADLLGRISRLPKEQQSKALKQIIKGRSGIAGGGSSRQEMEQRFMQLPKEIRDGLLNKRLQLADTRFYVVKDISGKNSIDVFQGTDQKGVGLGNLANQKLEKDNWFIIYAIIMRYAVSATGALTADFVEIPAIIRNGECELEAGNKKLIGLTDNTIFDTRNRVDLPIGYYKVENQKIIEPQIEIKMPVKFTAASVANSFLRVGFIGTSVIPF
ncbi:MAG: hypothetical protein A3F72_08895 [Bacteroidetes bacterium RIFCSPLOWO2_12_FULL_35_15]|nr:MAG: hypothetical protein A3F72_08895 [Bacteroidetes bacterium RIFCSPLOWO2_12_FULL_35_15]